MFHVEHYSCLPSAAGLASASFGADFESDDSFGLGTRALQTLEAALSLLIVLYCSISAGSGQGFFFA